MYILIAEYAVIPYRFMLPLPNANPELPKATALYLAREYSAALSLCRFLIVALRSGYETW